MKIKILIFLFLVVSALNPSLKAQIFNQSDSSEVFDVERINTSLHDTEKEILQLQNYLKNLKYRKVDTIVKKQSLYLEQEAADFRSYDPYNLSKFFLNNVFLVWSNYRIQFEKWQNSTDEDLKLVVQSLEKLNKQHEIWLKYWNKLQEMQLPTLSSRVRKVLNNIEILQSEFRFHESALVDLESRISDKIFLCDQIINETVVLQDNLRNKTFLRNDPAIWHISLTNSFEGTFAEQIKHAWFNNFKSAQYYITTVRDGLVGYVILILLVAALIYLMHRFYMRKKPEPDMPDYINIDSILVKRPVAMFIAISLLFWTVFFPYIPLLLADVILLSIVVSLGKILIHFIDRWGVRVLEALFLLLLLNIFELVFWYLGDYVRLYLLFETLVALSITSYFVIQLRKNYKDKENYHRILVITIKILPVLSALYFTAFVANIFGFVNLTVLLAKVTIRSVAMTMVALGFLRIFNTLALATMDILRRRFPDFSSRYHGLFIKRAKRINTVFVFLLWFRAILSIFEVRQEFLKGLTEVLTKELQIGTLSLSLSNIFSFILILLITYYIAVFIKKIIEEEILRNLRLPRGMPAAISMVLRIFFVALGVILAISAAGIDMGKFGIIAGALGVGIGFGLQNIVQNFISGLILIFERPIQVGDTVEVNNLMGKVKDIGVRASNVITYDGAEVVVPNSNLISNDLINWTLSDSRKRMEIKVGTAYGTNPNEVLNLMEEAALEHPDVVSDPKPRALFEGFGDSSLDFRLLFWVNFEQGLATQSDVAIAIYNKFAEHNIEIPFPQMDLHVKDVPERKSDELYLKPRPIKKSKDEETSGEQNKNGGE